MFKFLKSIVIIAVIATGGYYAYAQLNPVPCSVPIKYSLGEVNPGFKLSEAEFLNEINAAAKIWSDSVGRQLFKYAPDGELEINLIYDYRQQSTDKLKALGLNIENNQESYNQLKAQYQSMRSEYETRKAALTADAADYSRKQKIYSEQVKYWNAQGGAPEDKYKELQQQKTSLDAQKKRIEAEQESLKKLVENINALAGALNQLAQSLNLNISQYNTVGDALGEQFEEGVYVEEKGQKRIDIFEFQDNTQLTRLIAHELGHALGIEHVDDENAIMNWLNTSDNLSLTQADVLAVRTVCRIN